MREVLYIEAPDLQVNAFLVTCDKQDKDSLLDAVSAESILDICLSIHNHLISDNKPIRKNMKQHSFLIKNLLGMTKNFCLHDDAPTIKFKEKLATGRIVDFLFSRIDYEQYQLLINHTLNADESIILSIEDKMVVKKSPSPLATHDILSDESSQVNKGL